MRILLDTHILLWQFLNDPRLIQRHRDHISDDANDIFVSDVSFWEIAIKIRAGKLHLVLEDIEVETALLGYRRLAIERRHFSALVLLPKHHCDPFDHMLIAQANIEEMSFMSSDRWVREYPVNLVR